MSTSTFTLTFIMTEAVRSQVPGLPDGESAKVTAVSARKIGNDQVVVDFRDPREGRESQMLSFGTQAFSEKFMPGSRAKQWLDAQVAQSEAQKDERRREREARRQPPPATVLQMPDMAAAVA